MAQDTFSDIFKLEKSRNSIKNLLSTTKKKSDFQRIQCLWLRMEFNMSAIEISKVTNLKPGTVRKIWSLYRRKGTDGILCKDKGGRKHAYMTLEEEKLFLSPFLIKAEQDGTLIAADLKTAFENSIGQKVPKSTIYRLLKRHGWKRKSRKNVMDIERDLQQNPEMHDYWIKGCSQAIIPKRSGNISQQWLNSTLSSLTSPGKARLR